MTACGISVKAPFLSAEFSTYIYCLSSNLSLTEPDICPTVDWSCLPVPQNCMRHYLNSVQVGKAQFFCPWTLCGCWRQPSCWNQTVLFSPELPSWRKEEDNLFSLRLLMHSTYPNPNLAPALIIFLLLGCSTCGGSCLCIWLSKGRGVGCYSVGALLAQRLLQEGGACWEEERYRTGSLILVPIAAAAGNIWDCWAKWNLYMHNPTRLGYSSPTYIFYYTQ